MTSLKLTYVPIEPSMHVYLNGLEIERTQWTYNPTTGAVDLSGAGEVSTDRLECRYAHQDVVIPVVELPSVWIEAGYINTGLATHPLPTNTAGQRMIAVVTAYHPATPSGWTLVAFHDNGGLGNHCVYTKVSTGGEANIVVDTSGVVDVGVSVGVYPACTIGNVSTAYEDTGAVTPLVATPISAAAGRTVMAAFTADNLSGSNRPFLDAAYTVRSAEAVGVTAIRVGDLVSPGGSVGGTFYTDTFPVSGGSGAGAGRKAVSLIELIS